MAAPSYKNSIVWGAVAGNEGGQIGFYITDYKTASATQVFKKVEVWFRSNYTVSDKNNSYYYNHGATSASTLMGSVSISHTDNSTGWGDANYTMLGSYTYTHNKSTYVQTINVAAKFNGIDSGRLKGYTMTATTSYMIPTLAVYTISYNANGGSGAPGAHSYYYTKNTTLSNTIPKRDGYNFLGWSLSSTATSASYTPGQSWSGYNASNYILYAVWIKVHTITFDGNGGTVNGNSSVSQSATNGTNITIFPTAVLKYHTFIGWNTSADGSGDYYTSLTATSDLTLYAIYAADSNCYIKTDGIYQRGTAYVRKNGMYCKAVKIY